MMKALRIRDGHAQDAIAFCESGCDTETRSLLLCSNNGLSSGNCVNGVAIGKGAPELVLQIAGLLKQPKA